MRNVNDRESDAVPGKPSLIILLALLVIAGCRPDIPNIASAHQRGLAENPKREKMGLRRIEASWICFRSIDGEDEWVTDLKTDTAAVKVVKRGTTGSLQWEIDSYWSGRLVMMDDSKFQEEIKLYCDYTSGQLEIIYLGDDREIRSWAEDARTNPLRLEVIERVKSKWFGAKSKESAQDK